MSKESPRSTEFSADIQPQQQNSVMGFVRAIRYKIFIDPLLGEIRDMVSNFIPPNSSVIDIGCGTGALAFRLAKNKSCTVLGVDLDSGKIRRAKQNKSDSQSVDFVEANAARLPDISDQNFDYATMSLFLHSLPEPVRTQILQEAMRIAKQIVIADYVKKQPKNFYGLVVKIIEYLAGAEHFSNFNSFKESGGIETVLEKAGLSIVDEKVDSSKTVRIVVAERRF